jgi:hypothetical protein
VTCHDDDPRTHCNSSVNAGILFEVLSRYTAVVDGKIAD